MLSLWGCASLGLWNFATPGRLVKSAVFRAFPQFNIGASRRQKCSLRPFGTNEKREAPSLPSAGSGKSARTAGKWTPARLSDSWADCGKCARIFKSASCISTNQSTQTKNHPHRVDPRAPAGRTVTVYEWRGSHLDPVISLRQEAAKSKLYPRADVASLT